MERNASPGWDIIVRASHWVIAAVVVLNALISEGGTAFHVALGWVGGAFLALRMVWGLLGNREARFSAFPPSPFKALAHLGEVLRGKPREYPSHNPAGAMMVYALWLSLAVVIGTGLAMTNAATPWNMAAQEAIVNSGDGSLLLSEDEVSQEEEEGDGGVLKEVHELFANLMLVLAVIHVAGVALESRALRRNLVKPMITGRP